MSPLLDFNVIQEAVLEFTLPQGCRPLERRRPRTWQRVGSCRLVYCMRKRRPADVVVGPPLFSKFIINLFLVVPTHRFERSLSCRHEPTFLCRRSPLSFLPLRHTHNKHTHIGTGLQS